MLFQRLNESDPERLFIVVKNTEGSSLTADSVCIWATHSASVDGVAVRAPDTAHAGSVVGIREIPGDAMGLDVGPLTVERFTATLKAARTIVWNGPLGVFEKPAFAQGTLGVARAVAEAPAFSVVGGGDTLAAVNAAGRRPVTIS